MSGLTHEDSHKSLALIILLFMLALVDQNLSKFSNLDTGANNTLVDLNFVTKHKLPMRPELVTYLDRIVNLKV